MRNLNLKTFTPYTVIIMKNIEYRIVEIKTGFEHKFYVEVKRFMFWIFPFWVRQINPDHNEWTGTDFNMKLDCEEYISKCRKEKIKIIHEA